MVYEGKAIPERYFDGFYPEQVQHMQSAIKAVSALLTSIQIDKGFSKYIDLVDKHVSELKGEPFHGVITRQLLEIVSGIQRNEKMRDPNNDLMPSDLAIERTSPAPGHTRECRDYLYNLQFLYFTEWIKSL